MRTSEFVDGVIARVEKTPVDLALLAPGAVPGSIFTGAAGVALFLVEAARLRRRADLLPLAQRWLDAARAWAKSATPPEWNDMPWGIVMGSSGCAYVSALLGLRAGDASGVHAAAEEIERASTKLDEARGMFRATELLGGAAGIVSGARDLEARLPASPAYAPSRALLARARERARDFLLVRHTKPLPFDPADRIGLAHGVAGELWALVAELGPTHDVVRARLAELVAMKELDEEGLVYWLSARGDPDTLLLGSWCNGMAGHTLLWCEVARRGGGGDAQALAAKSAETAALLVSDNAGICCGLAGTSVALQRYADAASDKRVGRQAYDRLRRAIDADTRHAHGPFLSMWQGTLGVALVAMRRMAGEGALPCVEAERVA